MLEYQIISCIQAYSFGKINEISEEFSRNSLNSCRVFFEFQEFFGIFRNALESAISAGSREEFSKECMEFLRNSRREFMKISIKGVVVSLLGVYAVVIVGIIPVIILFPHALRSPLVMIYLIILCIGASILQGVFLAKLAGPEKFAGSALVCAGISALMSISQGIVAGVGAFVVGLVLLWIGRTLAKRY